MVKTYLRFHDLKARRIVNNRVTLGRWVKAGLFPSPVQLGPNTVAWEEDDVAAWQKARRADAVGEAA